ncbi:hypothetical protein WR25_21527 [Diploscapter pachys]|uniref:Ribosome biogenesis protein NOP53 n=1 Tax=Diploscapter pachys TaxID=2018661 RepID=A0A2A2LM20_9BILA|nr:hypothetical protein WR25_21527 [Diploscapter pachys]
MLSFEGGKTRKTGAAKTSRHKKKYWRKGTNVTDFEDTLASISIQKSHGGIVNERADAELFEIDKEPEKEEGKKKFTRKQQAALNKISNRLIDDEPVTLPEPKFPPKQSRLRQPVPHPQELKAAKKPKPSAAFDLWETELQKKVDIGPSCSEAEEHLMRYTKKKMPKLPPTRKLPPSLLPAVSIANEGASYNPSADEYQAYVDSIASKECNVMKGEKKIERGIKPAEEKIVTYQERLLEQTEGLVIDPRYKETEEDKMQMEEENTEPQQEKEKGKTLTRKELRKKKETARRLAKQEKLRIRNRQIQKEANNVFKAKKIHKELAEMEKQIAEKATERAKQKLVDKLTKRQKLGRGQFEEEEQPFLLQEELPENLRSLKPQGNILTDRVKSLQKRNILPVAGEKNRRRLPKKLKAKFVEKRDVREMTEQLKLKSKTMKRKKKA